MQKENSKKSKKSKNSSSKSTESTKDSAEIVKKIVPKDWYYPTKQERWQKLCEEIDAEFIDGNIFVGPKVKYRYKEWTMLLDHWSEKHGDVTRIRVPFKSADGLRFGIYREGPFGTLGKMLGMQDIVVGSRDLDKEFIIQANKESKIKQFFQSEQLVSKIMQQRFFELYIRNNAGFTGPKFPEKTDMLIFEVAVDIRSVKTLKEIFELMTMVLDRLCEIGSAFNDAPKVELE